MRPTYLYTVFLFLQGIAYLLAYHHLQKYVALGMAGEASLAAASIMFFAERWMKSATEQKKVG
jgi:hypothetical protein